MSNIEIPFPEERGKLYRFFEILPGALSYTMLLLPVVLSLINATLAAVFVLVYLLINFTRGVAYTVRSLHGFHMMRVHQKYPWPSMLSELENGEVPPQAKRPKWHREEIERTKRERPLLMPPSEVIHAVIIATVSETEETLTGTLESVLASEFDMKGQVIFILAYEGRAGEATEQRAHKLVARYKSRFRDAFAVKHPAGLPGEIVGKGGNINYAAHELQKYLEKRGIDPTRVMVTTLDADNRPDKNYLNAVTYAYVAAPDPIHASYQPVSLYTNNIWDVPAPMRVIATGNSLFTFVISLRAHALRNFSSHSQPMAALIQTDFWSARTVVEDGHQFWRSYFTFQGNYRVYPVQLPISQDAVLTKGYRRTLRAQFIQLRRWTYGASDVAYLAYFGFFRKNNISKWDLWTKFWRLLEGHVTWAVGPVLILVGGFIPAFFNHKNIAVYELPIIVSKVQTVGTVLLVITMYMALRLLPPKPLRYKRHRTILMVLQWAYYPVTTFGYNVLAAFNSQTRLMFKRYLTKFDVTEKAVVVETAGRKTETRM